MAQRSVLISGADGFLGRALTATFAVAGWRVFGLIRGLSTKSPPAELSGAFDYSFPDRIDPLAFDVPLDLFIHNAFQTRTAATAHSKENVDAARFLLDRFGRRRNCRFAFVSSMSAHGNAHSCYGVDKLTIERLLDPERDLAIRPGFILGYGGTFQGLARILSKLPLLPLFYGGSLPIHTVHVDDACVSILKLVEREITGVWPVGEETPVTIRHFFGSVATWLGRRPLFLPLPGAPFLHLLRMAERCGLQPPLGSDNLLGLRGLIAYDLSQTVRALDFRPTSLRESLSRLDPAVLMESLCPPSVRTRRLS